MNEVETTECGHMAEDLLAGFVAHSLQESQEIEVAQHLAHCAACAALVQQMHALRGLWADLAAQSSAQTVADVASALRVVAGDPQTPPPLRERVQSWLRRWTRQGTRVAHDLARTAKASLTELQSDVRDALQEWGWMWSLTLEPAPIARRGVRVLGKPRRRKTRAKGALRGGPAEVGPSISVTWSSETDIEVQISGLPSSAKHPMVLLVPLRPGFRPLRSELNRERGKWYAHFEGVEPGSYAVALEPLEAG